MRGWIPLLLVVAGVVTHANGLWGDFLYDDRTSILPEPAIRSLWPPWSAMWAAADSSYAGRPIPTLSLALNYALGGFDVRGWHAFNIAVHVLCGLVLFGVVRRTLDGPLLRERFGDWAEAIAGATALLWLVHPVQTVTVAYVTSRTESIMGLFYLLTLYCAIRAKGATHAGRWSAAAVAACALGMGSKESMVTAPLMVALYDVCFRTGSVRDALRERRNLYAGLASTWVLLAAIAVTGPRAKSVGFSHGVGPFEYLANQSLIVTRYLRLVFVPHPLNFDYGFTRPLGLANVLLPGLMLVALVGAVVHALVRRPPLGFPGAWFFGILAPTSTVVPVVTEVGSERRLYLAMAGGLVLLVIGGARILQRTIRSDDRRRFVAAGIVLVLAAGSSWASIRRNLDYRSRLAIWQSALRAMPDNPQAHYAYGNALTTAGRRAAAGPHYDETLRLMPDHLEARVNLGALRLSEGKVNEAISHFREALRANPELQVVHQNLGIIYQQQGRLSEADQSFREAMRLAPEWTEPLRGLAILLATHPDRSRRDPAEAVRLAERAVALTERRDDLYLAALSTAYEAAGRGEDALSTAREALDRAVENGTSNQDKLRARLTRLMRE